MAKSRIFLYALSAFIFGVSIQSYGVFPSVVGSMCIAIGVGVLACSVVLWFGGVSRTQFGVLCGCVLLCGGAGVVRYAYVSDRIDSLARMVEGGALEVHMHGTVADDTEVRTNSSRFLFHIDSIEERGQKRTIDGYVLVYADRYPLYAYGDELSISGMIERPQSFADFDYAGYVTSLGAFAIMRYPSIEIVHSGSGFFVTRYLFFIKHAVGERIHVMFPEPRGAFLEGILVGTRSRIPNDVLETFQRTGTTHIIALSGFNISIIASGIMNSLRAFSVGIIPAFWVSSIGIVLFTLMTGASASIVRASIMGILVLIAQKEGRAYAITNALVFTGACMIFQNPFLLRYDISFQLSFLATAGIVYVAPILHKYANRIPNIVSLRDNLISTLAAECMVLPLIWYNFGSISLISPLANILILSVIPITMFFGFLSIMVGAVYLSFALPFVAVGDIFLRYILCITYELSKIPFSQITLWRVSGICVAIIYGVISWLVYRAYKRNQKITAT